MQESKPLKTGVSLSVALSGQRIATLSNSEPILQALRYAMVLVGIRGNNLPNGHETAILVNYITKHYGGHTAEEIRLAFEMAVAGELDLIGEVTAYENFTVLYFSTIMNAYRVWAKDAYLKADVPHNKPPSMPTREQLEYESTQRTRAEIETFYQQIIQITKKIPEEIPYYFTHQLISDGLLKEGDTLADFFRKKIEIGSQNIYVKK